jgi:hypothetical protein
VNLTPHPKTATTSASGVAGGVEVTGDFSCCLSKRIPSKREQWRFLARETHWGHVFLVWELKANPRGTNWIGKRFVRWVK